MTVYPNAVNTRPYGSHIFVDPSDGSIYSVLADDGTQQAWAFKQSASGTLLERVQLSTVAGNPWGLPIASGDFHVIFSIVMDADRHIHITGNYHNSALHMLRNDSVATLTGTWTDHSADSALPSARYVFPRFIRLSTGRVLYMVGRSDNGGLSIQNHIYKWDAGDTQWTHVTTLSTSNGWNTGDHILIWFVSYFVDANDVIYAIGDWNINADPFGRVDPLIWIESRDYGVTWRTRGGGTLMTLPITRANCTPADTGLAPGGAGDGGCNFTGSPIINAAGNPQFLVQDIFGFNNRCRWNSGSSTWVTIGAGAFAPAIGTAFLSQAIALIPWRGENWWCAVDQGNRMTLYNEAGTHKVNLGPMMSKDAFLGIEWRVLRDQDYILAWWVDVTVSPPVPKTLTFGNGAVTST